MNIMEDEWMWNSMVVIKNGSKTNLNAKILCSQELGDERKSDEKQYEIL